ncbi:MAG: hypothetical protein Q9227_002573 [Pyrenula ochraceoflavens]
MRPTSSILTALLLAVTNFLSIFVSSSPHVPSVGTIEGKRQADTYAYLNLTEAMVQKNADSPTLLPRGPFRWCISQPDRTNVCVVVGLFIENAAFGIASLVKSMSNDHVCTPHTGTVNRIHYRVYATGRHCDTQAALGTIADAIRGYINDNMHGSVCGVQCIVLDNSGTWNGYVTLAPTSVDLDHTYCGPQATFGKFQTVDGIGK